VSAPDLDPIVSSEQTSEHVVGEDWQLLMDQPMSAPTVSALTPLPNLDDELAELVERERERTAELARERERSEDEQPGRAEPLERAVSMLLTGVSVASAAAAQSVGASTLRRYARVVKMLAEDSGRRIDCKTEKVREDLVIMIREHLRSERERGQGGERS
jgi:hypothetical protein